MTRTVLLALMLREHLLPGVEAHGHGSERRPMLTHSHEWQGRYSLGLPLAPGVWLPGQDSGRRERKWVETIQARSERVHADFGTDAGVYDSSNRKKGFQCSRNERERERERNRETERERERDI